MKHLLAVILIVLVCGVDIQQSFAQNNVNTQVQIQEIPKHNKVLALSRTNLSSATAKVGDTFCARLAEDLIVNGGTLIPSGSIVSGQVTKVKRPQRLNVDGKITLSINQIQLADGRTISLAGNEINGVVISPYTEPLGKRVAKKAPSSAAGYGSSIPLNEATNLNGGVIYAISTGASMAGGAVAGLLLPDPGRTRLTSSFLGALNSSPIGTVYNAARKGRDAVVNTGDSLVLNFDRPTIAKIESQYVAQTACPIQSATR